MGLPQDVKSAKITGRAAFLDQLARPRPYPYDTGDSLTAVDGGDANTFGVYALCIPRGTYDFGDSPNHYRIEEVVLEIIPVNDTYILEFYCALDDLTYAPIGAVRFIRTAPFTRSFIIPKPTRPVHADTESLYARIKDEGGAGTTVTFSLEVSRFLHASPEIPLSTGIWPFG